MDRHLVLLLTLAVAPTGCKPSTSTSLDGELVCWGALDQYDRNVAPHAVPKKGIAELLGTGQIVCARIGGRLDCLGPEREVVPDARTIAQSTLHSCALMPDGTARCWGSNLVGELGAGDAPDPHTLVAIDPAHPEAAARKVPNGQSPPVAVKGLAHVAQIVVGGSHSCARLESGAVWCWGANKNGQLGQGQTGDPQAVPVQVPGVDDAIDLAAADAWTCAVRKTGAVACWGTNDMYPMEGQPVNEPAPTTVAQLSDATAIAISQASTVGSARRACVIRRDASVWCFEATTKPGYALEVHDATALVAGIHHTCALRRDGTVACFGSNSAGELGTDDVNVNVAAVPGLTGATQIAAGATFTCARRKP